jgi:hypothetical protein
MRRARDRLDGHRRGRLREQRPARSTTPRSLTTTSRSITTTATPTLPTSATRWASPKISIPFLGWGDAFIDYDNDGWKDLLMVNGHVYPQVDQHPWGTTWAQRPLLFHNLQGKKFETVPAVEGTGLAM